MKLTFVIFILFLSLSVLSKTPGKTFKNYIKDLQKKKELKEKVNIGEGLIFNLSDPAEKFIFEKMDVKILKEDILKDKAEVYFLLTWPIKSIAPKTFFNREEIKRLKNKIPNEYVKLKKIGEKRVIKTGVISALKGKVTLYKTGEKWSQINKTKKKEDIIRSFCLTNHIKEAIELNKKRKILYSALTNGQSLSLSNLLIASEKVSLFVVKMIELQALPFNKLGINILCKEVISMKKAPLFKSRTSLKSFPKMKKFKSWNSKTLAKKLYKTYKLRSFKRARALLRKEMIKLDKFPGMYCMHRHVVESLLRTVNYGPIHKEKAKGLGLSNEKVKRVGKVSWNFILSQITTFPLAHQIDKMAFPFQRQGIPIICQDVPHIPEH